VLDTGVSPLPDLAGRLVHGPDLSGEGTLVDSYGHGTVMAGLIAGNGADSASRTGGAFPGVAPAAHVVSVKVAGRNGVVDVSTILEAMHWISAYREQFGIRVLNLSWGVASTQSPSVDPINHAVQRLWSEGIVVVVAAGNSGSASGTITKPGDDPVVLTVGAYDDKGDLEPNNDSVPQWSSRGPTAAGLAKPDLVAPGRTVVSLRSPGSTIERNNPKALLAPSYIRGSGTSQAAAVTSGAAALLLANRPSLTPDQVKALLTSTTSPIPNTGRNTQGTGRLQLEAAVAAPAPTTVQTLSASGLGSIDASRGSQRVVATCGGARRDPRRDRRALPAWTARAGPARAGAATPGPARPGRAASGRAAPGRASAGPTPSGPAAPGRAAPGSRQLVRHQRLERRHRRDLALDRLGLEGAAGRAAPGRTPPGQR
jgi:serine protease AprX